MGTGIHPANGLKNSIAAPASIESSRFSGLVEQNACSAPRDEWARTPVWEAQRARAGGGGQLGRRFGQLSERGKIEQWVDRVCDSGNE